MKKLWKNGLPALVLLVFGIVLAGCDNGTTSNAGGTKNNSQALADQLDKLITNGGSALSGSEGDVVRLRGASVIQLKATSSARKVEKTITIPKGVTLELGDPAADAALTLEGADTVEDGEAEFIFTITGGGTLFFSKEKSLKLSGVGTKLIVDGGITAKFGTASGEEPIDVVGVFLANDLIWKDGITFQVYAPLVPSGGSANGSFADSTDAIPGKRPDNGPNLILGAPDMIYANNTGTASPFTFIPIAGNTYGNVTMKGVIDITNTTPGYVAGIDSTSLTVETTFGDIIVDEYAKFDAGTAAANINLTLGTITARNKGVLAPIGQFGQIGKITIEDTGLFNVKADFAANEIDIKKGGKLQFGVTLKTLTVNKLTNAGTISTVKVGTTATDGNITIPAKGVVTNSGKIELGDSAAAADSLLKLTKATLTNTGTIKLAGKFAGNATNFAGQIELDQGAVIENKAGGILDLSQPTATVAVSALAFYGMAITFKDADDESGSCIKLAPGSELHGVWISGTGSGTTRESVGFYKWSNTDSTAKWQVAQIAVDLDESDTTINLFNGFSGKSPAGESVTANTDLGIVNQGTGTYSVNGGYVAVSGDVVLRATAADAALNGLEIRYTFSD